MAGNPRSAADSRGRPNWAAGFVLLNRKRQEVFRPVLENPRALVLLNVRELAGKLKVDPATVVRVVSKLDFVNYRSFSATCMNCLSRRRHRLTRCKPPRQSRDPACRRNWSSGSFARGNRCHEWQSQEKETVVEKVRSSPSRTRRMPARLSRSAQRLSSFLAPMGVIRRAAQSQGRPWSLGALGSSMPATLRTRAEGRSP